MKTSSPVLAEKKTFKKFVPTFQPLSVPESRSDLFSFTCGCKSISREAAAINYKFIEARLHCYIT